MYDEQPTLLVIDHNVLFYPNTHNFIIFQSLKDSIQIICLLVIFLCTNGKFKLLLLLRKLKRYQLPMNENCRMNAKFCYRRMRMMLKLKMNKLMSHAFQDQSVYSLEFCHPPLHAQFITLKSKYGYPKGFSGCCVTLVDLWVESYSLLICWYIPFSRFYHA